MKTQRGAAMVEFAIIALLFFMILFAIIEFGRVFFTYNTLVEATRRGARIAAVCPVSQQGITQVKEGVLFTASNGLSSPTAKGFLGLQVQDVTVSYLNSNMGTPPVASDTSPIGSITDAKYDSIAFVRVEIAPSFQHTLVIPVIGSRFSVPAIQTTLPSESLGRLTPDNPITKRCCFGVCS